MCVLCCCCCCLFAVVFAFALSFVCLFAFFSFLSFFSSGFTVGLVGSWFHGKGSGLGLGGGSTKFRMLDNQRIPGPREY